jgi:hypothetical protein
MARPMPGPTPVMMMTLSFSSIFLSSRSMGSSLPIAYGAPPQGTSRVTMVMARPRNRHGWNKTVGRPCPVSGFPLIAEAREHSALSMQ